MVILFARAQDPMTAESARLVSLALTLLIPEHSFSRLLLELSRDSIETIGSLMQLIFRGVTQVRCDPRLG